MKLITSNTKKSNYIGYLFIEIIMVSIFTFLTTAVIVFYFAMRMDRKKNSDSLMYLFDNPIYYGVICILPVLISVFALLMVRNRNYVVGFSFNEQLGELTLTYRSLFNKKIKTSIIPYSEVSVLNFKERKILFNQTYRGKRIWSKDEKKSLDFVINNFVWEDRPRDTRYFLNELNKIRKD